MRVRGHREVIRTDTREALAAYFAGERLYEYIYPLSRIENPEKLNWRRFQTVKHYRNYPKEIGKKYLEGIYRGHPITRKYDDPAFDKYLIETYDAWFRRDIAMPSLYLPELFVVCSLPNSGIQPISKLDEQQLGLKPYPVVVYPQHVRDFEMDNDGNIEWISFDSGSSVHIYTPDEFLSYTISQNEDSSLTVMTDPDVRKKHGFSRCPVVRIAYEDNASYADVGIATPVGHAMMHEIVSLSIAELQYQSMLIEATYAHLFYKVVMGQETATQSMMQGIGNSTVLIETPEEKGITRYMPTPSYEINALINLIENVSPKRIYQMARLRDHSAVIAQSGLAKTFDMVPETGVLTDISTFLSDADARIVDLLASASLGPTAVEAKIGVVYPASFDVRGPLDMLGQFSQFTGMAVTQPLPTSKTAIREMMKDMQRSLLPNADSETLQEIDLETDNAPFASSADPIVPIQPGQGDPNVPVQQFQGQGAPAGPPNQDAMKK